jgi:hypothetical protein
MNVNEELEIKVAAALMVKEPFDQTLEFEIHRVSIFEPGLVPIPQPLNELDALTVESTISKKLIFEASPEPVPIPDPSDTL